MGATLSKESWYRESASLELRRQQLVERAKRGLISAEEFMQQMLRLYTAPDTLLHEDGGKFYITSAWVDAHAAEIKDTARSMANGVSDLQAYAMYEESTEFLLSTEWEAVLTEVHDALRVGAEVSIAEVQTSHYGHEDSPFTLIFFRFLPEGTSAVEAEQRLNASLPVILQGLQAIQKELESVS